MNLVGKIFTVLIFLMGVVFGTFALMTHAAHTNWRQEVIKKDGLNDQLVAAKKIVEDLTGEKKILETELAKQKDDLQKRIIALQEAANSAIAAQKVSDDKIQVEEQKSSAVRRGDSGGHQGTQRHASGDRGHAGRDQGGRG